MTRLVDLHYLNWEEITKFFPVEEEEIDVSEEDVEIIEIIGKFYIVKDKNGFYYLVETYENFGELWVYGRKTKEQSLIHLFLGYKKMFFAYAEDVFLKGVEFLKLTLYGGFIRLGLYDGVRVSETFKFYVSGTKRELAKDTEKNLIGKEWKNLLYYNRLIEIKMYDLKEEKRFL